jgi:hypothetical protein
VIETPEAEAALDEYVQPPVIVVVTPVAVPRIGCGVDERAFGDPGKQLLRVQSAAPTRAQQKIQRMIVFMGVAVFAFICFLGKWWSG